MKRKSKGAPHTIDYFFDRSIPEPNTGCWIWLYASNDSGGGYGSVNIGGKMRGAHRAAYECANGVKLDSAVYVCHRCDVSMCVNPAHLFLGTHLENMADCVRKGRNRFPVMVGEDCHKAKLTEADVTSIRTSSRPALQMAKEFGVSRDTIYAIRSGKTWKHVARTGVAA